jgi:hypothetical protein
VLSLAAPRHAAKPACVSFKAGITELRRIDPKVKVIELPVVQRGIIQNYYNHKEPATQEVFTHIYMIPVTGTQKVLVVFVKGADCVFDSGGMSADKLGELIGSES